MALSSSVFSGTAMMSLPLGPLFPLLILLHAVDMRQPWLDVAQAAVVKWFLHLEFLLVDPPSSTVVCRRAGASRNRGPAKPNQKKRRVSL